jgi:hypothetical protein
MGMMATFDTHPRKRKAVRQRWMLLSMIRDHKPLSQNPYLPEAAPTNVVLAQILHVCCLCD